MVYFITSPEHVFIGWTRGDPAERCATFQRYSPFELSLYGTIPGGSDKAQAIRSELSADCERGYWFSRSDAVMSAVDALVDRSTIRDAVLRHSLSWAPVAAWETDSNAAAVEAGFLQVQDGQARRTKAGEAWVAGA